MPSGLQRSHPRRHRGTTAWTIAIVSVLVLWFAASVVPSPYAVERPGPVINALGEYIEYAAGSPENVVAPTIRPAAETAVAVPVISIQGTEHFADTGELNILSVSVKGTPASPARWIDVLQATFDPAQSVVPVDDLYPQGIDVEERNEIGAAMMRNSQMHAIAAALTELDIAFASSLRFSEVIDGGPSVGLVYADDRLVALNGQPVDDLEALQVMLAAGTPGQEVQLTIERGGLVHEVSVTPAPAEVGGQPLLGVMVATDYEFPFEIEVSLGRVGGSSAGMMISLGIMDRLTPESMTHGLRIAGTGTVTADGAVGPIGGVQQKLWAAASADADLMLLPLGNCADVPQNAPRDLMIATVSDLTEAIAAIETRADGGTPPGLERCSAGEVVSGDR